MKRLQRPTVLEKMKPFADMKNAKKQSACSSSRIAHSPNPPVVGVWLAGASVGPGSPIPTRIAEQLRGRKLPSFDAFRKAFWKAIAADPELSRQFKPRNLADMAKGFAPAAPKSEHAGKRISFELHHVELIRNGGAVYDMDNLKAVTPKLHIDIHRETK